MEEAANVKYYFSNFFICIWINYFEHIVIFCIMLFDFKV